jgi:hypothetical protein
MRRWHADRGRHSHPLVAAPCRIKSRRVRRPADGLLPSLPFQHVRDGGVAHITGAKRRLDDVDLPLDTLQVDDSTRPVFCTCSSIVASFTLSLTGFTARSTVRVFAAIAASMRAQVMGARSAGTPG